MQRSIITFTLFLVFFIIYTAGSFAKILFADCVLFVYQTDKGDYMHIATATSHFLYVNTAIFIKNITGIDVITANRYLVIFFAEITVSMVYLTVFALVKKSPPAVAAAVIFGFSFSFWKNAEIVEVYTYNCFLVSLFFLFTY